MQRPASADAKAGSHKAATPADFYPPICTMVRDAGTKSGFADVVPLFFLRHDAANEFCQLFVAGAAPHLRVQVVIPDRKQAGADLAVAGDADAAAMSAERMRHRSDDADLADAIFEAIAPRRLRTRMRDLDQRAGTRPCAPEFRRA